MVNCIEFHSFHLINPAILLHMALWFCSLSAHLHAEQVVTCNKWLHVGESKYYVESRKGTTYGAVGIRWHVQGGSVYGAFLFSKGGNIWFLGSYYFQDNM